MIHAPTPHALGLRARVYGLLFLYGILASLIFGHRADAAEPKLLAEPNPACIAFAAEYVPQLHAMFVKQVPPEVIRHLIVTEEDFSDRERGLLVSVLQFLTGSAAKGYRPSESSAAIVAAYLCQLETPALTSSKADTNSSWRATGDFQLRDKGV